MEAVYYFTENGKKPVKRFIEGLLTEERAEIRAAITDLERQGYLARRPLSDNVRGKVNELRARYEKNRYRILYYFCYKQYIVLLHGIKKKTSEIPEREIVTAEKRMKDFETRIKQGKIKL